MRKVSGAADLVFLVVEYSKWNSFCYMNDGVILLLQAFGIPESVFLRKQQEHLDPLSTAPRNPRDAFQLLSYVNEGHMTETILMEDLDSVKAIERSQVNIEYGKLINKSDEQRCCIFVRKSRLIFGVCDPRNVLQDGECTFKITMDEDGVTRTIVWMEILVSKNPCLHSGDL